MILISNLTASVHLLTELLGKEHCQTWQCYPHPECFPGKSHGTSGAGTGTRLGLGGQLQTAARAGQGARGREARGWPWHGEQDEGRSDTTTSFPKEDANSFVTQNYQWIQPFCGLLHKIQLHIRLTFLCGKLVFKFWDRNEPLHIDLFFKFYYYFFKFWGKLCVCACLNMASMTCHNTPLKKDVEVLNR